MNNRHHILHSATALVLAMLLGVPAANAAEVWLQAEEFQKTISYASSDGAPSHSIAIVNSSFEEPDCSLGGCTVDTVRGNYTTSATGWVVTGSAGVFRPNASIIVPTDGAQVGWSNGGALTQTLAEELAPNTTYTLIVDVGDRTDAGFAAYTVALYAGGLELAADNSGQSPSSGWAQSVVSYTTGDTVTPGQALSILLDAGGVQVNFDNVRLEAQETAASITMWGYSECGSNWTGCGAPSSPGPQIDVTAGDSDLTIHLNNLLPEATSIMIAGQRNTPMPVNSDALRVDGRLQSLVPSIPAGGSGDYTWLAGTNPLKPGTFLYQSGSHVQLQVQMGLYGAVVAAASGCGDANCAYADVGYDTSEVLIFSEIDPALHDPVPTPANATVDGYVPTFFLVNGEPFDGMVAGTSPIAVANASFESPDCTSGCTNSALGNYTTTAAGWSISGGSAGVYRPVASILVPTDGAQVAYSNGGMLAQVLSEELAPNTTYTLTVDVGDRTDTGFPGYSVGLYAGGVLLDEDAGSLSPSNGFLTSTVSVTTSGTVTPGQQLEIRLDGNGTQVEFDNVRLQKDTGSALASAGDSVLLRMVNASLDNRVPVLLGGRFSVVAQDGNRMPVSHEQYSVLLPAAKSIDAIFEPTAPGIYTLFDRRSKFVTGPVRGGGMLHRIVVD